jgi:hypothetical protein
MSVLTEEQQRAIDDYMATDTEYEIDTIRHSKRELYDRLQSDPKFDACYKQAVSEQLVKNGQSGRFVDSGYPDDDPVLQLARQYAGARHIESDKLPEHDDELPKHNSELNADKLSGLAAGKWPVYIAHVENLTINIYKPKK